MDVFRKPVQSNSTPGAKRGDLWGSQPVRGHAAPAAQRSFRLDAFPVFA